MKVGTLEVVNGTKVNSYISLKHFMVGARGHGLFLVRIRERIFHQTLRKTLQKVYQVFLSNFMTVHRTVVVR